MTMPASPRFALPLLAAAQSHKDITHNEALILIEALLSPVVQGAPGNSPPSSPAPGQCWATGSAPTGEWAGEPQRLAIFTGGGWRFIAPVSGMACRISAAGGGGSLIFASGAWQAPPALALPGGGTVIDSEARTAIAQIVARLQLFALAP